MQTINISLRFCISFLEKHDYYMHFQGIVDQFVHIDPPKTEKEYAKPLTYLLTANPN